MKTGVCSSLPLVVAEIRESASWVLIPPPCLFMAGHVDDDDNVSLSICLLEHTLTHAYVHLGVSLVVRRSPVKARLCYAR